METASPLENAGINNTFKENTVTAFSLWYPYIHTLFYSLKYYSVSTAPTCLGLVLSSRIIIPSKLPHDPGQAHHFYFIMYLYIKVSRKRTPLSNSHSLRLTESFFIVLFPKPLFDHLSVYYLTSL